MKGIRLGGATLDSAFPLDDFRAIVFDRSTALDGNDHCGFVVNPTTSDVTLTVVDVRVPDDSGASLVTTCASYDSYFGPDWPESDGPTPFPEGTRIASCEGAQLRPGWGCWIGLRGATSPGGGPATGVLEFTVAFTCTSGAPPACSAVTQMTPSASEPIGVTATISYTFDVQPG